MVTKADVFIIESLDPDDEGNGRFEGSSLSHILRLHGKDPRYSYVRTKEQFIAALKEFSDSSYRYLHISAHADADGMCTTNLDDISYSELAALLNPYMKGKRLFLSACAMVHEEMAKAIIPLTQCTSIVGPRQLVGFAEAAVMWPAVYHLMFSASDSAMTHAVLKENLKKVSTLFDVELGYFSKSKLSARGYTMDLLKR